VVDEPLELDDVPAVLVVLDPEVDDVPEVPLPDAAPLLEALEPPVVVVLPPPPPEQPQRQRPKTATTATFLLTMTL